MAVLLLGFLNRADAAIVNASDCSLAAVRAACALASPGDTVQVPAGKAAWTGTLTITKDIQVIGAGVGQTIIADEIPRTNNCTHLILWVASPGGYPRLSGLTFQGGVTNNTISQMYDGTIFLGGTCATMRIDNCMFTNLYNVAIWFGGAVVGVVDHSTFIIQNWGCNGVQVKNGNLFGDANGWGDTSWATPVQWGSTNGFVYVESCAFSWWPSYAWPAVNDLSHGGRMVFRFNLVTNLMFQDHGTIGRVRAGRAFEVYGNYFQANIGWNGGNPLFVAGGTGVIFSNTFSGFGTWSLVDDRAAENFGSGFGNFGGANGQNPWESNNPAVLYSGTHTGTNGSPFLLDANANWTPGQWFTGNNGGGYVLQNVSQGGSNTLTFALITGNTANTITYVGSKDAINGNNLMLFTNGQTYKIYQTYARLDQVGRGSGDLIVDTVTGNGIANNSVTGSNSWPHQVSEPLYQWANTLNGATFALGTNNYSSLQSNRDYFDNVAKPGYVPLPFPHPLVSAGTTNANPGSGGGTITPPSNLQAVPPAGH